MRPSPRGWVILAVALGLYVFANQTQVGWLYVLAALTAGVWLVVLPLPARLLRGLSLTRRVNGAEITTALELHAGETIAVDLELHNPGRLPALQVRGEEICPPAPREQRAQPFFIEHLPPHQMARLHYSLPLARRGLYAFPPVRLSTRAPFGLAHASRTVAASTELLVFPGCRELKRLRLFDRLPAPQSPLAQPGAGSEFLGVREYRPGDPRRHVHWRSTARMGRLVVKEFAEETQPGLTLALDLRRAAAFGPEDDDSLELAIQVIASLARRAEQQGLPVHITCNSRAWPAPPGPLSGWGLMSYLARVEAEGEIPFEAALRAATGTRCVAAVLCLPEPQAAQALIDLHQSGRGVLAVLIDPARFGAPPGGMEALAMSLRGAGVDVAEGIGAEPDWERVVEEAAG